MTDALRHGPSDLVGGRFLPIEGDAIVSRNPANPDDVIWCGTPAPDHVDPAVAAARAALPAWAALTVDERVTHLRCWQAVTAEHRERIAGLICDEMGKTMAECLGEAGALGAKVDITLDPVSATRVRSYQVDVTPSRVGWCRFRPHGVMAVIGPFNFPAHLPNGHFVPALLTGNTIVFKPSEKTPAVGQMLAELMDEAGLPPGVFNLVQGGGDVAATLVDHDGIDGILFTGSWPVGRRILEANLDRPGRIVALEMGGNNPTLVLGDAPFKAAVVECVRTAFATTGQRCSCTRRIIVDASIADRFIPAFARVATTLVIGPGRDANVFMGPLITGDAADRCVEAQDEAAARGDRVLVEAARPDRPGHFVSPAVVETDRFDLAGDEEIFGPFVRIAVARDLDDAIEQANATRYGLAASVFTTDDAAWSRCLAELRVGCLNRNTGTAGASSKLPFGGLGHSGNHRPAGAFSVDYCAAPVASLEEASGEVAVPGGMVYEEGLGP